MPVVQVDLRRFAKMVGADRRTIIGRLPYIGLDIESLRGDVVRVEYSPNRPDLGTDFGIARALKGLLGLEVGMPAYAAPPSGFSLTVDRRLSRVRPHIACAVAKGLSLEEEDVRQIISLQEDLHNGLGRKRKRVAIGLHDLAKVRPPLAYAGVGPSFSFIPLGSSKERSIREIISGTPEGRAYGSMVPGDLFPVITDSAKTVLSFPPVINGNTTRVTSGTKGIFVDVTGTDSKAVDDALAIMATTLAEAGASLGAVSIRQGRRSRMTPDLRPVEIPIDVRLIRSLLGLSLDRGKIVKALARSRLSARGSTAIGARYRIDLLHPVDVAEEVALGYGMDRIEPVYPASSVAGKLNPFEEFLDSAATVLAGSGMIEMMTFELVDEGSLYSNFGRSHAGMLKVQDPKSIDHSVLRDALIPTLLSSLSSNARSEYPQRVFEIGRVFARSAEGVTESWHLGCLVAHSQSSFSEAKMYLEAACRTLSGKDLSTEPAEHWAFSEGRCASASDGGHALGFVGELRPEAISACGLGVPVSGFEIDLSRLYERLK